MDQRLMSKQVTRDWVCSLKGVQNKHDCRRKKWLASVVYNRHVCSVIFNPSHAGFWYILKADFASSANRENIRMYFMHSIYHQLNRYVACGRSARVQEHIIVPCLLTKTCVSSSAPTCGDEATLRCGRILRLPTAQ